MAEAKEPLKYSWIFRVKEADQILNTKRSYRELLELVLNDDCQLPREDLVRRFEEIKNKDVKL